MSNAVPPSATVALLGMPNTGKSTLFNRLTGGHARVANWPGLTVDLLRGSLLHPPPGARVQLIDLPGIHDLSGSSADEAVVRDFLATTPPDLMLLVLNASLLAEHLRLALALIRRGQPLVLALNMSDEARRHGVSIDVGGLSGALGVPVLPISARRGQGIPALERALADHIPPAAEGCPGTVHPLNLPTLESLIQGYVHTPPDLIDRRSARIDRVLLDPLLGLGLFLLAMLALFQAIYALGAPLQQGIGALGDGIRTALLAPLLATLHAPPFLSGLLLEGLWLGVVTVTGFLPVIFLFYLAMSVVEDSGYLARAAFLTDGVMRWFGLDGRAFVLQLLGFGCNVPAILGTRILRDPAQRLLAMLVIPLSLCQARLTVFVFLAGVFFPRPWWAAGMVVFGYYLLSILASVVAALLFQHVFPSREAYVLELPPYRRPGLRAVLRKAWREVRHFLFTTRSFILIGATAIWFLSHVPAAGAGSLAMAIGHLTQPLLAPLGMDPQLSIALMFGFLAKEILLGGMAVIYGTDETHLGAAVVRAFSTPQALSFMTFTLLYTPCLSTLAVQLKESRSRRFVALSLAWSLGLAWLWAFATYRLALAVLP